MKRNAIRKVVGTPSCGALNLSAFKFPQTSSSCLFCFGQYGIFIWFIRCLLLYTESIIL